MNTKTRIRKLNESEKVALGDVDYISNLMDVYPVGILSLVSDTFDYWGTITKTLPILKDKILARNGKVVIRPDSGNPVRIVAGYKGYDVTQESEHDITINLLQEQGYEVVQNGGVWYEIVPGPRLDTDYELKPTKLTDAEVKGSIQCLYDIFGGTKNEKGFIELDPHIGLIYGDGITIERVEEISQRLADKGFASTNLVYGIGSYTYLGQVSRDTDGWAMKATAAIVDDEFIEIYKDPKTDTWGKKSAKGLIAVYEKDGTFVQKDQVTWDEVNKCAYKTVFQNGKLIVDQSLAEIRERAAKTI